MLAPIHRLNLRQGHRYGSFCGWRLLLCATCMATEGRTLQQCAQIHKADITAELW